jgi:hypothetical protein
MVAIFFVPGHHCPETTRGLVSDGGCRDVRWPPRHEILYLGPGRDTLSERSSDDGSGAVYQQSSQVTIAALADAPDFSFPPLALMRGVRTSHAAKWREDLNCLPSPTAATTAVAVIGPTPGAEARRWLSRLDLCQATMRLSISPSFSVRAPICRKRHRRASLASSGTTDSSAFERRSFSVES